MKTIDYSNLNCWTDEDERLYQEWKQSHNKFLREVQRNWSIFAQVFDKEDF
jgi:hypothetical protein